MESCTVDLLSAAANSTDRSTFSVDGPTLLVGLLVALPVLVPNTVPPERDGVEIALRNAIGRFCSNR